MMEFATFKWKPAPGYRSKFDASTVNVLWSMLARNFAGPCRLTCITDDPIGISEEIRVVPLWDIFANLSSPHGAGYPSCYRRLPLFGDKGKELFSSRFMLLDLDVVICRDITPLTRCTESFKIWGDTARGTPYNGSLYVMEPGARSQVWEQFDPIKSPQASLARRYIGSDQGWIGACLGPGEAKFGTSDGIYSYRNHIQRNGYLLPANARIVIFHGAIDPWSLHAQRISWVRKYYR